MKNEGLRRIVRFTLLALAIVPFSLYASSGDIINAYGFGSAANGYIQCHDANYYTGAAGTNIAPASVFHGVTSSIFYLAGFGNLINSRKILDD